MSASSSDAQGGGLSQDRYRWRGPRRSGNQSMGWFRRHRVQIFWIMLLTAALLLFAWLIWLLLLAPRRTPVFVFSADAYSWPLPPNGWASEDIEKLAVLDGESVTLRSAKDPIRTRQGFLDRLDRAIRQASGGSPRVPLVLWVSMHGIAHESDGKPYLVPPESSPLDSNTWIDLEEVFSRIAGVAPEQQVLLILDSQRMQVNWNVGLLQNAFTEKAEQILRERGPDNLAVLTAAAAGQQSTVSRDLQGSVFGHYARRALAGAADRREFGNEDGWVSLQELHRYLQTHVGQWSERNRGSSQNPQLVMRNTRLDFPVAKSLNRRVLNQLVQTDRKVNRLSPNLSVDRIDRLWRQLDGLRGAALYRREPIAWRDLEHKLLWLEQLSVSGSGYHAESSRAAEQAEAALENVQTRLDQLQQDRSLVASCSVVSGEPWQLPNALRMHSLPLAAYVGTVSQPSVTETGNLLRQFRDQPIPTALTETLTALSRVDEAITEDHQFLRMLDRYQFSRLWRQPQVLSELLDLRIEIQSLAVPRDASGMPDDGRSHRWTRELFSQLGQERRTAEDQLFVDQGNSSPVELSPLRAALDELSAIDSRLREINGIADRAMAELPYLSQWMTNPKHRAEIASTDRDVNERLLPLISNTWDLSRQLAQTSPITAGSVTAVSDFADSQVAGPLKSLMMDWDRWNRKLLVDSESNRPELIGEIDAVLSTPLTTWELRRDLRDAGNRLAVRLHTIYDDGEIAVTSEANQDQGQLVGEPSLSRDRHPFHAIMTPEGQLEVADDAKTNRGNAIVSVLRETQDLLNQSAQAQSLVAKRELGSRAARRIRAAASIWFPVPKRNPIQELRQIDLTLLLVWHAQRAMTDFWGPAGQARAFFDLAASDYLSAADRVAELRDVEPTPAVPSDELTAMARRLDATRRAAPDWLETETRSSVQLDPSDPVRSVMKVHSNFDVDLFEPPDGTATLLVRDAKTSRFEQVLCDPPAVSVPATEVDATVSIPAQLANTNAQFQAQAMFRGHEYGAELPVDPIEGFVVDLQPHRYRASEVTLSSPWNKLSVVFVLDCSQSMERLLAEGGEQNAADRLEIATSALQEILFDLAMRKNVRVGVRFFGHRLGWSNETPVRALIRPDFANAIAADLTPSQDVESVLPLDVFGLDAVKRVLPRLNSVKPWGQSPLYLSVAQAIDEFGAQDADADRHIIVITDGANYQYIPPAEPNVRATTDNDVRAAWAEKRVPVHILGLGMDRSSDPQAVEEFTRLCLDTGGRFQALSGSTNLAAALNQLLAPGRYRLGRTVTESDSDRRAVLGKPIRVVPAPKTSEQFALTYEGRDLVDVQPQSEDRIAGPTEKVWLEGGESIQLYVNRDEDAIHAYPFDANVAAQGELVASDGTPTDHIVRLHRPRRRLPDAIVFPVSWQRRGAGRNAADPPWLVTERPADIWIEVQPLSDSNESIGPSFVFYDANYEPDQPVPKVELVASDWPKSAVRAGLRIACQPPPSVGFELLPPTAGSNDESTSPSLPTTFEINETLRSPTIVVPGISLQIEGPIPADPVAAKDEASRRLRFVLDFSQSGRPVTSLKVNLPPYLNIRPARIVRRFDETHRLAVHEYYFGKAQTELPVHVEISSRENELQGAWHVPGEPLTVDISESGMFLPVSDAR